LDELAGCERLIVVDACRSGDAVGTVRRLRWPDPRIARQHGHSSHGVSVCEALELAERLEQLPPVVEIVGIEVLRCQPETSVSPTVLHAVVRVATELCGELLEVAHA
jgi:hydrogenase maturation protease